MSAPFPAHKIKNPSAGNDYFNVAGTAISDAIQPENVAGAVRSVTTASITNSQLRGSINGEGTRLDFPIVATSGPDGEITTVNAGSFAYWDNEKFVIRSYSTTLAGIANTNLQSPGSTTRDRSIDKVEAIRTIKTATAIRNNQWVPVSGTWSVDPSTSSDLSAAGIDKIGSQSRSNQGASYYYLGSATGVRTDYDLPT